MLVGKACQSNSGRRHRQSNPDAHTRCITDTNAGSRCFADANTKPQSLPDAISFPIAISFPFAHANPNANPGSHASGARFSACRAGDRREPQLQPSP